MKDLCEAHLERQLIALCECTFPYGKRINGESVKKIVEVVDENFCKYCGHAVEWRVMPSTWKPEDGFTKRKDRVWVPRKKSISQEVEKPKTKLLLEL